MRRSADWQVLLDDRILELFEEEDNEAFFSPSEIAEDERIRYSAPYVGKRCRKLADHGLLQRVSQSVYRITDEGRAYLRGEYDVEKGSYIMDDEAHDIDIVDEVKGENGEQES